MRDEFDGGNKLRQESAKSLEITSISRMRRRNDPMASRRMADEQANAYYNSGHSSQGSRRRSRRHRDDPDRLVENLGGYKIRIPPFHGNNNPDEYMDWEKKCEFNFNLHNISNINRVKLAVSEFNDYALRWWEQVVTAREIGGALEVSTWEEMKRIMRQREATMSGSLEGSTARSKIVEMQNCVGLESMLHKAVLAEQQLKRKTPSRYGADQRRPMYPRDSKPASHQSLSQEDLLQSRQGQEQNQFNSGPRARELKCFKCQGFGHYAYECRNKKMMIIRDNGEVESEEEIIVYKPEQEPSQKSMRPFLSWESSGGQKDLKRSSPNPKGSPERESLPFTLSCPGEGVQSHY
ncbi:unnamed protein product [Microthlaspi erraticum]|uniref:CCHC-type domain-containing protein n=1 Tax=Microthlaspi erraticum TaxID=1685480 RepID=A0A6D2JMS6_9BRAS|nr:unnamed protein product [Microthlaspi erraticum]